MILSRWDTQVVRSNAVLMLGRNNDSSILIPIARENRDPQVRLLALEFLLNNYETNVTAALMGAARDSDWRVRRSAIMGLSMDQRETGPEAIPVFIRSLEDPHAKVRMFAVLALTADTKTISALPGLRKAAHDEDETVRRLAVEGLEKVGVKP